MGVSVTKSLRLISSDALFKNKLLTAFVLRVNNYKSVNIYLALAILASTLLFIISIFFPDKSTLKFISYNIL